MYENRIKTQRYIIKSSSQFDYLFNYVLKKKYVINVTGFLTKRHIYINVRDNTKQHKELLIIFDVSHMSRNTYIKYARVIK